MSKQILYVVILWMSLIPLVGHAQETEYIIEHSLGKPQKYVSDAYTIYDKNTEQTFLFLFESSKTFLYVTNTKGEVVNAMSFSYKEFDDSPLLSYAIKDNKISIITELNGEFYIKLIDLKLKTCTQKRIWNSNSDAEHLCWYEYKGESIGVGAFTNKNALLIYKIDATGIKTEQIIDLGDNKFLKGTDQTQVHSVNKTIISQHMPINLLNNLTSLKIYKEETELILSYDLENETRIIRIDLNTFDFTYKKYLSHWNSANHKYITSYNSYILENYLMRVKSTYDQFVLDVVDMETGDLKDAYYINSKEYSILNSSEIYEFGGLHTPYKEVKRIVHSPEIIKNMSKGQISIFAKRVKKGIQVQFGSVYEFSNIYSKGQTLGDRNKKFDNIINTLNLSTLRRLKIGLDNYSIIEMSCLLDDNFEVKPIQMLNGIFDEIAINDKEHKRNSASSITVRDNDILYGYYLRNSSEYIFKSYSKE